MKKETKEETYARLLEHPMIVHETIQKHATLFPLFEQYHKERMVIEAPSAHEEQAELQRTLPQIKQEFSTSYQLGWNRAVEFFNKVIFDRR